MIDRRELITTASALALSSSLSSLSFADSHAAEVITKTIPKSGEPLPVIGMGTSRTFNTEEGSDIWPALQEVTKVFLEQGGTLIDSSPMYGPSEGVTGKLVAGVEGGFDKLFAATKVWTNGEQAGIDQMNKSFALMGVETMDLMQIHNLRDWQVHLKTLRAWKDEGRIRYIGITTSHGRNHEELSEIMQTEDLDFVQFSYSIDERTTENNLLPIAEERGIATLINRPFRRGDTFSKAKGKPLPDWASEIDCTTWGQFFLKFAVSHPGATCVIPATSKPKHMIDNMGANVGRLPDTDMRKEMISYFESL